ncbi:MFS transporter [Streptomyces hygroscopicus subsp. hygroscopicus]|uniref:MFS transporter n=1 Tax=Streptomyces hygroscopicus TaxID=1912 RepID=UPI001C65B461|nr:MFS transporter [Streptomyces hygroscopicus]MBW8093038.1 MFS transporter [Streptomyces hygroscopicus subsp. hygroscopicus]
MRAPLLPVLLSGTFVQLVSVTVMQVAVPDIRQDLGAGPGAGQLALAGYTLTYACSLITSARLGDRFGYRRLFVVGMAVFTLASLAAAAAPATGVLVVGRLVQGLGSGLVAPQILSVIQSAVPEARRPRALGSYGATMAVASLAGPLLGGILLQLDPLGLGWRAALALPVPVGLAALALSSALPPGRGRPGAGRVDVLGAGLSLSGLVLLVLPLTLGQDAGWPVWTWISLVTAVALLAAFVVSQRRVPHPLVHPSALAGRTTRWGIGAVLVFNAGVPSLSLLLSLHLQGPLDRGPLQTALTVTPYAVGALLGSGVAEAAVRRYGAAVLAVSAGVLAAVSLLVAATITASGPALWLGLGAGGMAFGVFTASVFSLVLEGVPANAASSVSGLLPTAQQLGGTLGVAVAGVVYAAPAAGPDTAFWHAMGYEAAVFGLAAAATAALHRARSRAPRGAAAVDLATARGAARMPTRTAEGAAAGPDAASTTPAGSPPVPCPPR